MAWYCIVLIVYAVFAIVISLLSVFIKPLRMIAKGFWITLRFFVEIVYLSFVWWWLSLLRLLARKEPLRWWLFRRKP